MMLYKIILANTSNSDIILHIVKLISLSLSLSLSLSFQSDNLTYTLDSFHYFYFFCSLLIHSEHCTSKYLNEDDIT